MPSGVSAGGGLPAAVQLLYGTVPALVENDVDGAHAGVNRGVNLFALQCGGCRQNMPENAGAIARMADADPQAAIFGADDTMDVTQTVMPAVTSALLQARA